ncbi:MAG TPA: TIGR03084 family metal-binding protein [Micromonosporaceae bacterium]
MVLLGEVLADLTAESAEVDALVADRPEADWHRSTPAAGWTVAHQVAHLAWTDNACLRALADPAGFLTALGALDDPTTVADRGAEEFLDRPGPLLARWRAGRGQLNEALAGFPDGQKIPWYGPPMSPISMATSRIMETWAHGLDIADALGVTRPATARLRHIAHLGHRTLAFSFLAHGRPAPTAPVRLELTAPDGSLWTYGPADASDQLTGPALDFCLLVTQRRHRDELELRAAGPVATEWLEVAQAFAGPPGPGREVGAVPAASDGHGNAAASDGSGAAR